MNFKLRVLKMLNCLNLFSFDEKLREEYLADQIYLLFSQWEGRKFEKTNQRRALISGRRGKSGGGRGCYKNVGKQNTQTACEFHYEA